MRALHSENRGSWSTVITGPAVLHMCAWRGLGLVCRAWWAAALIVRFVRADGWRRWGCWARPGRPGASGVACAQSGALR